MICMGPGSIEITKVRTKPLVQRPCLEVYFTKCLQKPFTMHSGEYQYITVERKGSNGIYVITLRKPPQNRLNVACCQELIHAYHSIQRMLGPDSEGAVILRGNDSKFFCTVSFRLRFCPGICVD